MIFSRGGNEMLLNFRFTNFKSFSDLTHYSMISGRTRKHPNNYVEKKNFNVLTFSAIYGPNAGGKSNFVDAIGMSQAMVLNDLTKVRTFGRYNKNDTVNKSKQSDFEYEISMNEKVYVYGFSVLLNKKQVVKEYLLDITSEKKEIVIFAREQKEGETAIDINYDYLHLDDDTKTRVEVYKNDLSSSVLFLKALNSKDKKTIKSKDRKPLIMNEIYKWFEETLEIISPMGTTDSFDLIYLDEKYLKKLGEYLSAFDTGVKEVKFEKVSEKDLEMPIKLREKIFEDILRKEEQNDNSDKHVTKGAFIRTNRNMFSILNNEGEIEIREIRFIHNSSSVTYALDEESDGTKRIIDIFSILLDERKKVYVVDELDRSLHPNLTYQFVEEFIKKKSEDQLIVTTHEERLLDLNLLRRDQFWFVERDKSGNSSLYSLEEYKERFDTDIQKRYLDGRYGSVPKLNFDFIN